MERKVVTVHHKVTIWSSLVCIALFCLSPLTRNRILFYLPLLAGLLPVWMAWSLSCVIPRADSWAATVTPYLKWQAEGAPFLSVLHDQMNDSRMDSFRALTLSVFHYSGGNQQVEAVVAVLIGIVTCGCLLWLLRRFQPGGATVSLALAWVCGLLWLTPDQGLNWTWGVQICYGLAVSCTLLMVVTLLTSLPLWLRALVGGLITIIGSHAFVIGWLGWGLGLVLLGWEGRHVRWRSKGFLLAAFIWLVLAAGTVIWSFQGYHAGASTEVIAGPSLVERMLDKPQSYLYFFIALLGSFMGRGWAPWEREQRIAWSDAVTPWLGTIALVLFVAVVLWGLRSQWRQKSSTLVPFLLLGLYGLAGAAAVTVARVGHPLSDPFQERYSAFVLWFHFGLLAMLAVCPGRWRWIFRGWLVVVITGYSLGFYNGVTQARRDYNRDTILVAGSMFRHVAPEPAYLDAINPGAGPAVVTELDALEKLDCLRVHTLHRETVADTPRGDGSAVKGKIKKFHLLPDGRLEITGLAYLTATSCCVDAVVISCQPAGGEEVWLGVAQRRQRENKLAEQIGAPAGQRLGWQYTWGYALDRSAFSANPNPFKPKPVPSGEVTFRAYAVDIRAGKVTPLEGEATLTIPAPAP